MRKKKSISMSGVLLSAIFICYSCGETVEEKAAKASREFCECYEEKSLTKCENELNSNYGSYSANETFIKEFNAANTCGIYIYKKTGVKSVQAIDKE